MPHSSHKFKAYCGDVHKPLVFCENCGIEDHEASINLPCAKTFHAKTLDIKIDKVHPKFVSGLPD